MSTFDGVIREYPLISIDRFLHEENFASTVYFLSHCHADHMIGLGRRTFFKHLVSRGFSKIYVSDVSKHLLKNDYWYKHLEEYVVGLPLEHPTIIILYDENGQIHSRVVVTLLTAGHCPGSVMFLIEGNNGRVLYTGDFRLPVGSSARLVHLHDDNGRLKSLQSLYVDTTFCNADCPFIPSREQCLTAIISLVEPWIFKGPNYIVCFLCPAQYAYEFVFVELYKRYGVKTHVRADREKKYIGIKSIEEAVTSVATAARIHACARGENDVFAKTFYKCETPCGYISPDRKPIRVLRIKPCAFSFQKSKFTKMTNYDCDKKMQRVCYSTHPSLSEVRDMVKYLKPKVVYPNVVHKQTVTEILYFIYHFHIPNSEESKSEDPFISPLRQLSPKIQCEPGLSGGNDSLSFFDECYETRRKQEQTSIQIKPSHSRYDDDDACIETDFENTEELDTMLKEEICFSQVVMAKHSIIDQKTQQIPFEQSQLKWQNPIVSSDDEAFDVNKSLPNSQNDKSDSETLNNTMNNDINSAYINESKETADFNISQKSVEKSADCISCVEGVTEKECLTGNSTVNCRSVKISKNEIISCKQSEHEVDFVPETQFSFITKLTEKGHCSKSFSLVKPVNGSERTSENKQDSYQHILKLNKSENCCESEDELTFIRKITDNSAEHLNLNLPVLGGKIVHSNAINNKREKENILLKSEISQKLSPCMKTTCKASDLQNNILNNFKGTVSNDNSSANYTKNEINSLRFSPYNTVKASKCINDINKTKRNSGFLKMNQERFSENNEIDRDFKKQPIPEALESGDGLKFDESLRKENIFSEMSYKSYTAFHSILGSSSDDQNSAEIIDNDIDLTKTMKSCFPHANVVESALSKTKPKELEVEVLDLSSDNSSEGIVFLGSSLVKNPSISKHLNPGNCTITPKYSYSAGKCDVNNSLVISAANITTVNDGEFQGTTNSKNWGFKSTSENYENLNNLFPLDGLSLSPFSDSSTGVPTHNEAPLSNLTDPSRINTKPIACTSGANEFNVSDSDDSPSLIAPVYQVSKNVRSVDSKSIYSFKPKKMKTDDNLSENSYAYKNECCDTKFDKDICDMDIVVYDSTPEDLIENHHLHVSSNQAKSVVAEIFIDD